MNYFDNDDDDDDDGGDDDGDDDTGGDGGDDNTWQRHSPAPNVKGSRGPGGRELMFYSHLSEYCLGLYQMVSYKAGHGP